MSLGSVDRMKPCSMRNATPRLGLKLNFLMPSRSVVLRSLAFSKREGSSGAETSGVLAPLVLLRPPAPPPFRADDDSDDESAGVRSPLTTPSASLVRGSAPPSSLWRAEVPLYGVGGTAELAVGPAPRPAHETSERRTVTRHSRLWRLM